ncbi:MAG: MFS transporter [Clostridia bacterium]|nr:MFS transporter [Clostridia bacterium]
MYSLLLAIIYLSFISLGLPDSLLGSAWPVMSGEIGASLSLAGPVSMIISAGTVFASLFADRLTQRFHTRNVTAFSVLITAVALLGFARVRSYPVLCLLAVPYGLGAGAVDAALNNFVALHYKSRHMNWLHCFWGVGATISPYIMSWAIGSARGWRVGYGSVSLLQFGMALILVLTLPLWKKVPFADPTEESQEGGTLTIMQALKMPGVKSSLVAFFSYCALETTAGLWASSFLVKIKGMEAASAAGFASLFYLGITLGRFVSGFVADRVGDKNMIRIGVGLMALGVLMILIPVKSATLALVGLMVAGVGGAPYYPALIHSTPDHFGRENSHAIVGLQMASAYTGSALAPPVFGFLAQGISLTLYPWYLALFVILMGTLTEQANHRRKTARS